MSVATTVMVVVRFQDGRMVKGTTQDFMPSKPKFHIIELGKENDTATEITVADLKAVFFVKSFDGHKGHVADYNFQKSKGYGRKCIAAFNDGEVIAGFTAGYSADRQGFFLIPAEVDNNNERVFVVNSSVKSMTWV